MTIINDFNKRKAQTEPIGEGDLDSLRLKLEDSYFSEGHIGSQYGQNAAQELVQEHDWKLTNVSIDSLLDADQKNRIVTWLEECEEIYGYFEFNPDPIIIASQPNPEQPLNMMPGYTIYDGWHRLAFAVRAGKQTILAYVGTPK